MKKLLLVDGNSMLFRAFYATAYGHSMTSSSGIPTNAIYGFAMMLQKAIDLVQPDSILVAFDAGKHTFRHELYADYKGGRRETPEELRPQFGLTRDYLDGYHIDWIEMADIEADDLIGSMAKQTKDYETVILSSDHDLLQLVDDNITVMLMKKGISDMAEMTPNVMRQEMGIEPIQIIDMKGLMGDKSDNIPGIAGVGEKTALKLLAQYGTVENILDHTDELKGALKTKVENGKESALLSKKLATIRTDVQLSLNADDCSFDPDYASLVKFFRSLDINSLANRYKELANQSGDTTGIQSETHDFEQVDHMDSSFLKNLIAIGIDCDNETYLDATLYGFALTDGKQTVYISLEDAKNDVPFIEWLSDKDTQKIGYDIKRALHVLKHAGLDASFSDDTMIMASLADSTLTNPEKIFTRFSLTTDQSADDVYGKQGKPHLPQLEEQIRYTCQNAKNIYQLYNLCKPMLEEYEMISLYKEIEMPLTLILFQMEEEGIRCDAGILSGISQDLATQIKSEQDEIFSMANKEFNINSPKQLGEVLYDDLGLPSGKKRSTGADVLEKLKEFHPIIPHILTYRKLQKLYSTYAEGLQKYIHTDGRIHTLYNQCATQTGRLSSSEPNLQNISVRDEQGRMIRRAFLPEEDHYLLACDYHQIELRMLAHMANEEGLLEAFRSGLDVHTKTAMDVFGVSQEEVTPLMRRRAKTVNFGIVYGISDFGLGEQLGISRKEAQSFIDTYYEKYPGIRTYMDSIVKECEEKGYVTTLCGRRREIPEIHDKNRMVREFGRRAAMNAPIQGSAADLIKLAMQNIDEAMKKANVTSKMILQVHDELIFDVPGSELEQMKQLVEDGMIHAMKLNVPLTVECAVGKDWYEAK